MPFGVFILCKILRFSHSLDFAQNPQQNSELEHLIKFQLEIELARNILTDRARAQACSKSLKVVELELEPKSSKQKARASSKLELLATLWPSYSAFEICSVVIIRTWDCPLVGRPIYCPLAGHPINRLVSATVNNKLQSVTIFKLISTRHLLIVDMS